MRILRHDVCWLCGSVINQLYWEKPPPEREYNHRYVRCGNCGLVTVSPYADDPYISFNEGDATNYVRDIESYVGAVSNDALRYITGKMEQRWADFGNRHKGKLLEVGCAAGYFLFTAQARDWRVEGVELGESIASWGKKYLHLPIQIGPLEALDIPEHEYDVVAAIEVLEHVLDPLRFLSILWSKLKPGGMLFLTTPNVYSPAYYPPAPTTAILEPNDHLNLFSEVNLRQLVAKLPFSRVIVESDGPSGLQLQVFAQKPLDEVAVVIEPPVDPAASVASAGQSSPAQGNTGTPPPPLLPPSHPPMPPTLRQRGRRARQLATTSWRILRQDGIFILLGRLFFWLGGERRYYKQ